MTEQELSAVDPDEEPVLQGYLGKDIFVFLNNQTMEGTFAGYDHRAYYLGMEGEYVTINRDKVDMLMPSTLWNKIKAEEENV